MRYLINGDVHQGGDENFYEALARLAVPRRVFCLCKEPGIEMSVHLVRGAYHLWCMPNTAMQHSSECAHYEPPASISGKAQVMGTAIDEGENGEVTLKLDFALTKIAGRAPPEPKSGPADVAKADPNKLTMRGLLHYLWQEAGFHKWSPRMVGTRNDWVFNKYIVLGAANKRMRAGYLSDLLVVPKPQQTHPNPGKGSTAAFSLARATNDTSGVKRLALVLGEVHKFEAGSLSRKLYLFNMPEQSLALTEELFRKVEKAFGAQLSMWEPGKNKLFVLGSFFTDSVGNAVMSELVLMNTTQDLMPFESMFEKHLIALLTGGQRRFTKSLRFNVSSKTPMASIVLTDTVPAVALFIQNPGADQDAYRACMDEAQAAGLGCWLWRAGVEEAPALPSSLV